MDFCTYDDILDTIWITERKLLHFKLSKSGQILRVDKTVFPRLGHILYVVHHSSHSIINPKHMIASNWHFIESYVATATSCICIIIAKYNNVNYVQSYFMISHQMQLLHVLSKNYSV